MFRKFRDFFLKTWQLRRIFAHLSSSTICWCFCLSSCELNSCSSISSNLVNSIWKKNVLLSFIRFSLPNDGKNNELDIIFNKNFISVTHSFYTSILEPLYTKSQKIKRSFRTIFSDLKGLYKKQLYKRKHSAKQLVPVYKIFYIESVVFETFVSHTNGDRSTRFGIKICCVHVWSTWPNKPNFWRHILIFPCQETNLIEFELSRSRNCPQRHCFSLTCIMGSV